MSNQVGNLREASAIFSYEAEEILIQGSEYTVSQFEAAHGSDSAIPLVIPAHNEARRLPGTLLAAANNGNIIPIVVDNNSTDETVAVAQKMGATVIEAPHGKKMAATQAGLEYCTEELGTHTILYTDADTHVPRCWGNAMLAGVQYADKGKGSALFGHSLYTREQDFIAWGVVNLFRTLRAGHMAITNGQPAPRGHNYALHLDRDGLMKEAIMQLEPNMMGYDDGAIYAAIRKAGANVVGSANLDTWVVSEGDRIATNRQLTRAIFQRQNYLRARKAAYQADYGVDIVM